MTPEFIAQATRVIADTFGSEQVRIATEGPRTLVRIAVVELYLGSRPPTTPMLLVFDPSQPKPAVYVQPGQLLANGKVPTSTSTTLIGNESWLQFSFNIPWAEQHGILRFIAAARQRFVQDA
ncbi:MAG TPA: hypothetical protein VMJ10_17050 [Kofleriaceae bacterium]|nr:hypothetical protein [Kofleriaceae bacterium]